MTEVSPWAPSPSTADGGTGGGAGKFLELVAVVLLGIATVGSAWSAYQVTQWNGVDTDEARRAAVLRIDSSRAYGQATQTVAYDAAAVAQYAVAVSEDDTALQDFLRAAVMRADFLPVLDQWSDQLTTGQPPTNLLDNEEYLEELFAESTALDLEALAAGAAAEEAGQTSDDYVQLTLFFAVALFFAGVTASFRARPTKLLLLGAAVATLAVAGVLLADYPVA